MFLSDSNLGATVSGVTTIQGGTPDNTACTNKVDFCGYCVKSATAIYGTMELNASLLQSVATSYPTDLESLSTTLLSHEFGHVVNLADNQVTVSNINNIPTIMYQGTLVRAKAHILLPQATCDGGSVNSFYAGYMPGNMCAVGSGCNANSASCQ